MIARIYYKIPNYKYPQRYTISMKRPLPYMLESRNWNDTGYYGDKNKVK